MKDILERIDESSPNESSHELICRLHDCAREIERLRGAQPDHSGDGGEKTACRELTDDDMDRVTTLIGQHESGELGFHGFCESIIKEFGGTAPVPRDGDERAAFEAWARTADMPLGMYSATDYADGATQISWDAWQAALASNKAPQDGDQRELLEGLAMRLESGRLFNGVAQPNADIYARALRTVLASNKAAAVAVGEPHAIAAGALYWSERRGVVTVQPSKTEPDWVHYKGAFTLGYGKNEVFLSEFKRIYLESPAPIASSSEAVPVAWMDPLDFDDDGAFTRDPKIAHCNPGMFSVPLYTHPAAAQPDGEN
jgi:hypothetical protein